MNHNKKKILKVTALFVFMFFLGWGAGSLQKQQMKKTVETVSVQNQADNWGLGFGAEGTQPTGNVTADELKKYNAWYVGDKNKKTIYLTFDCGYENGNTEPILDALKKHNAKATFFVVGHFLESAPDIVKRMEEEGHAVGNHTYHHPDMSSISELVSFQKEIDDVASLYQSITGKEMIKYYRPPQGKYSTENLKMAKELGYNTFFWSLDAFGCTETPGAVSAAHNPCFRICGKLYQADQRAAGRSHCKNLPRAHVVHVEVIQTG